MFFVPDEVDEDATYAYLLTVSADNAEDASVEVTVTVLNKGALAVVCADPGSVYEGSEDIAFDCSASGAPGDNPEYAYAWTARGDTQDTSLLSATDIASPTFHVPAEVDEDETYEYLLTVSADNAEDASVEVTVTVLNKGRLRCMRGPGFGLRGFGRHCVRLLGIRGSGRQPRVRVRVDGSRGYAGYVALERYGHCHPDVPCAGGGGRRRDLRVPAYG